MMDQAQEDTEIKLMAEYRQGVAQFEALLHRINENSDVIRIDMEAWAAFVHDELPSSLHWDEKMNDKARDDRPYLRAVK